MGINVDRLKNITIDDTHNKRVNMDEDYNPTHIILNNINIGFIFQRNKTGDKDRDGNPLIYALKEMNGFKIQPFIKRNVFTKATNISSKLMGDIEADFLLPVPSSKNLCQEISQIINGVSSIPILNSDFIVKKTFDDMISQYDGNIPTNLSDNDKDMYKSQLSTWKSGKKNSLVSMKNIPNAIRIHFNPFKLDETAFNLIDISGKTILIIEDLMSSGSSIISISDILISNGAIVRNAICLMSPIH